MRTCPPAIPLLLSAAMGCAASTGSSPSLRTGSEPSPRSGRPDPHSYSDPRQARVSDVALDLDVRFERRVLEGAAILTLERLVPEPLDLVLDTRDLEISSVESQGTGEGFAAAPFRLGSRDAILGAPLTIRLPAGALRVRVAYRTSPNASGLQWLNPEQTAARTAPYLFTQSQAIHARSWIPLQDTPGVRQTYSASIRVPEGATALMSASREARGADGSFRFRMTQPIPSYLVALAVGHVGFESLGPRSGVWTEPPVLTKAAHEFADTEAMISAAEELFGPYRWERYELLVLPPSFPYGGMENPRLTFATPTILAGDRSLVDVVAHELAHSWSGNLVTNSEWADFWLNEGFTTYCEHRIVERVFGAERAEMEWVLGRQSLDETLRTLPPADQILRRDVSGRDPDEALTQLAYDKGALFLRTLERAVGRPRFDAFLQEWFDRYAFHSVSTKEFLAFLDDRLFSGSRPASLAVDAWLFQPGLPANAVPAHSAAFDRVDAASEEWLAGKRSAASLPAAAWTTHEWLRFLGALPRDLARDRAAELDAAFAISSTGNAEVLFQWLLVEIRSGRAGSEERLEAFLTSMGRRKYLKPLYEALVRTPAGRQRALAIYRRARPGYHPIAVETVDKIVGWNP
ncbi:MAG: M1 family metallopeptidase [Acidobacteriota bacterium]